MSIFKKSPKKKIFQCKRDELIIRGTEYRFDKDNLPIVILSHGFMANQSTVKRYAIELAKEGYAAFTFDFCGGCVIGKSDGKTSDMTVFTEVKDLESVIEYAKSLPYTNEKDITLVGCSQGGFVSALVASKRAEEISNLILFYPALCIPEDARNGNMLGTTFDPNNIPEILKFGPIKIGKDYPASAAKIDAYKEIKKFTKDVLILHGTADSIVPLKYSKHAYNEYIQERQNACEKHPVEFEIIKNGKHGFSKKHDKIAIQHVKKFLEKSHHNHHHKHCHKKRRNPITRFFSAIFKTIFFLIAVIAIWCLFSVLHKKDSLSLLPNNYSIYANADSIWEAVDPVIDLQAADILLSKPEMAPLRGALVSFRKSPLRSSKITSVIASRPLDVGIYMEENEQNIVAVVDMGVFSAITRLSRFVVPYINVKGLSFVQEDDFYSFEYATKTDKYFIKPYRNTVLFSTNYDYLKKACEGNNKSGYTSEEIALLKTKTKEPVKIIVDAKKLLTKITSQTPGFEKVPNILSANTKALVSLDIQDSQINLIASVPLENNETEELDKDIQNLAKLIKKESNMPRIMSQMSDIVQYYTIINAGTLQEITQASFPLMPDSVDIESSWQTANILCKTFFSMSLDDILFSWTGKECAAIGIEGLNAPVFVLQIDDEAKRRQVFDNVLSSLILHDDTSLILNGIRLPKIYLPPFIQSVLKSFGVILPSPYYLVHDGFIYFSESPEVLSSVYNSSISRSKISNNANWQAVSKEQKMEYAISLFYDLERSEPFFLRGENIVSSILELYTIGRCDIRTNDSIMTIQLSVSAKQSRQLRSIPGFPMELESRAEQISIENTDNPSSIFWVENGKKIKAMNISSTQTEEIELSTNCSIVSADEKCDKNGVLWAITEEGAVYYYSADLKTIPGFPILLEAKPTTTPTANGNTIIVPISNGKLVTINSKAEQTYTTIPNIFGTILSSPTVLKDRIAVYDKGFLGKIFVISEYVRNPYEIMGIAYGSPALILKDDVYYTAFVTQAGKIYIWNETDNTNPIEKTLKGVFFCNVVSNGNYFFALASNGTLYRISIDGQVMAVQIPNATAKEATLTVSKSIDGQSANIFVGIDGNLIYGFNENMELLKGFPITGTGKPVFADINGDGSKDCFALTIDNKLNAWNLR